MRVVINYKKSKTKLPPSDDDNIIAIKGSIKKWQDILCEGGVDRGGDNCPLCLAFTACKGCPITKLGYGGCTNKEYRKWVAHQFLNHTQTSHTIKCEDCVPLALAELNFLKRLLP